MAFYCNQSIKLIISLILFIISQTHAGNDNLLVKRMCDATNAPVACTSCVNNAGKDFQVAVDLIKATIDCANSDLTKLVQDVEKILHDKTTDSKTRQAVEKMNDYITNVLSHKGEWILRQVIFGDFSGASKTIDEVVTKDLITCSSTFSASGITIPPSVFSGLLSIETDYKLTKQLINTR